MSGSADLAAYGELLLAVRSLIDDFVEAAPDRDDALELGDAVRRLSRRLREVSAAPDQEWLRLWGASLPGRGHVGCPPWMAREWSTDRVIGSVTFRPVHRGGNGAVHGGALSMLFDEIMGLLANYGRSPIARTANLTLHYRQVAPVGQVLRFAASVNRVDGRKRSVVMQLRDASGRLLTEGEGLFVALRPGQP